MGAEGLPSPLCPIGAGLGAQRHTACWDKEARPGGLIPLGRVASCVCSLTKPADQGSVYTHIAHWARWPGVRPCTSRWKPCGGRPDMAPASPLPSICRCPAASRSFLLGPGGPAGAPPGHRLRSGGYMAAIRSGTKDKISPTDVSTLSGEPRGVRLPADLRHFAVPHGGGRWLVLCVRGLCGQLDDAGVDRDLDGAVAPGRCIASRGGPGCSGSA